MGRVAPTGIGDFFWRLHNEKGVDILLETTACRFEAQHDGITTVCSDGERLDADVVVIGIGTIPEAELAAAAGVRSGDGIFVNEFCEPSISGIFTAGGRTSVVSGTRESVGVDPGGRRIINNNTPVCITK